MLRHYSTLYLGVGSQCQDKDVPRLKPPLYINPSSSHHLRSWVKKRTAAVPALSVSEKAFSEEKLSFVTDSDAEQKQAFLCQISTPLTRGKPSPELLSHACTSWVPAQIPPHGGDIFPLVFLFSGLLCSQALAEPRRTYCPLALLLQLTSTSSTPQKVTNNSQLGQKKT